jgi:hypothetical protein
VRIVRCAVDEEEHAWNRRLNGPPGRPLDATFGFTKGEDMIHPKQFQVHEAWIVFRIDDRPIHTEQDGAFHLLALMDAASCFMLSVIPVPTGSAELSASVSRRLLQDGYAHKQRWPGSLFIPSELTAKFLADEAERLGIGVLRVAEEELQLFISEARQGFSGLIG